MNNVNNGFNKFFNIYMVASYIVLLALSFVKAMYTLSVNLMSLDLDSDNQSLFSVVFHTGNGFSVFLGIFIYLGIIVGIVFSILQLVGKIKKRRGLISLIISGSVLVLYTIFTLYLSLSSYVRDIAGYNTTYNYKPFIIFWIYVVLMIIMIVLSILILVKDRKETHYDERTILRENVAYNSYMDKLIPFQELMNQGVITQEEYELKKAKLLAEQNMGSEIACSECGTLMPEKMMTCPNCGAPNIPIKNISPKEKKRTLNKVGLILVIVGVGLNCVWLIPSLFTTKFAVFNIVVLVLSIVAIVSAILALLKKHTVIFTCISAGSCLVQIILYTIELTSSAEEISKLGASCLYYPIFACVILSVVGGVLAVIGLKNVWKKK